LSGFLLKMGDVVPLSMYILDDWWTQWQAALTWVGQPDKFTMVSVAPAVQVLHKLAVLNRGACAKVHLHGQDLSHRWRIHW
jgi:hypothetical protein